MPVHAPQFVSFGARTPYIVLCLSSSNVATPSIVCRLADNRHAVLAGLHHQLSRNEEHQVQHQARTRGVEQPVVERKHVLYVQSVMPVLALAVQKEASLLQADYKYEERARGESEHWVCWVEQTLQVQTESSLTHVGTPCLAHAQSITPTPTAGTGCVWCKRLAVMSKVVNSGGGGGDWIKRAKRKTPRICFRTSRNKRVRLLLSISS